MWPSCFVIGFLSIAFQPGPWGVELRQAWNSAVETEQLAEMCRQVAPTASVIATVDTRSWTITLQGKVASRDDLEMLLRVARSFGAGSPSMILRYEIKVDPTGILTGLLDRGSETGGCVSTLGEWVDVSCCKSDVQ